MNAAEACAQYLYEQLALINDYSIHVERGGNPKDHILWSAAEVLGVLDTDGFMDEWQCYNSKLLDKLNKRESSWA
jgi:hypothetical protein